MTTPDEPKPNPPTKEQDRLTRKKSFLKELAKDFFVGTAARLLFQSLRDASRKQDDDRHT